jgi:hypothetical protein
MSGMASRSMSLSSATRHSWSPLGGSGRLVDGRRHQNVLPAVVTDDVEPALRVQADPKIALRRDDALLTVQRPGDHLAVVGLDDRGPAAAEQLLAFGKGCGEVSGNAERGMYWGTDTTNAPDSIAMWRIEASQPSESSPVGAIQICGPPL